jgi:exopolysaccharide production protein ExoQ
VPALHLAVFFGVAAFMAVNPPVDPLTRGLTPQRVYELGLLVLAVAIALVYAARRGSRLLVITPEVLTIFGFTAWALLSVLWSENATLTIGKAIELLLQTVAAGTIALLVARRGGEREDRPMANLLTAVLAATLGLFLLLNVVFWGTPLAIVTTEEGRDRFVLGHTYPLATADFVALLAIALALSSASRWLKMLALPALIALVYLTDARGALIGLAAVGIGLLLSWLGRRDLRLSAAGVLLAAGLLGAAFMVVTVRTPVEALLEPLLNENVTTVSGRTELWSYSLELIEARPLQGYGYYAVRNRLLDYLYWAGHAHNSFIEIALTTGLVGLGMLGVLVAQLVFTAARSGNALLASVLTYVLLAGMLNPLLLAPGVPMFVLMLAALHARVAPAPRAAVAAAPLAPLRQVAVPLDVRV